MPSDNSKSALLPPYAPTNYVANHGGPGVIRMWSGTIVEFLTVFPARRPLSSHRADAWWGADSNLGFFGFESVTDGTANTGLFSEKLLGWPNGNQGGTLMSNSSEARRGLYNPSGNMSVAYNNNSSAVPLQSVLACQQIQPGTSAANNNNGWFNGFSWALGYEWYTLTNSYHHYNTPNKLNCTNPADIRRPVGRHCGHVDGQQQPSTAASTSASLTARCGSSKTRSAPPTWWALGSRNLGEVVSSDQY